MTEQEIFDKVIKHLYTQKVQAIRDGDCAYRGENGTMCAVGCLLTDEEYDEEMETMAVDSINLPERLERHVELLGCLQTIHDHYLVGSNLFTDAVKDLSKVFNLTLPVEVEQL